MNESIEEEIFTPDGDITTDQMVSIYYAIAATKPVPQLVYVIVEYQHPVTNEIKTYNIDYFSFIYELDFFFKYNVKTKSQKKYFSVLKEWIEVQIDLKESQGEIKE